MLHDGCRIAIFDRRLQFPIATQWTNWQPATRTISPLQLSWLHRSSQGMIPLSNHVAFCVALKFFFKGPWMCLRTCENQFPLVSELCFFLVCSTILMSMWCQLGVIYCNADMNNLKTWTLQKLNLFITTCRNICTTGNNASSSTSITTPLPIQILTSEILLHLWKIMVSTTLLFPNTRTITSFSNFQSST
jgi:hypothetical protein